MGKAVRFRDEKTILPVINKSVKPITHSNDIDTRHALSGLKSELMLDSFIVCRGSPGYRHEYRCTSAKFFFESVCWCNCFFIVAMFIRELLPFVVIV